VREKPGFETHFHSFHPDQSERIAAMSLAVKCPDCDKMLKVKDEAAGKKIRCPACSTVFPVPAKSGDDEVDFLSGLDEAVTSKRKRRSDDDLDDEVEPDDAPRSRTVSKGAKKKSRRGKPSGTNWLLIGGLTGGGLVLMLFLGILVAAVGQARKVGNHSGSMTNWSTFRHPMGFASVDMPGIPTLNVAQSVNGSQTYSLAQRNFLVSLTSAPFPEVAQLALATNPAAVELMLKEIETKSPQQTPGARLISSRRISAGSIPGLEMKLDIKGNINLMRFYVFPKALIGAEFITRNESIIAGDRDRFFNSLRGPDGNLLNDSAPQANTLPSGDPANSALAHGSANSSRTLTEARRAVQTKLIRQDRSGERIPEPPKAFAKIVHYDAPSGQLAAYLTTILPDGKKRPAVIWISGGDFNSIDDGFFKISPPNNDQTAGAFWRSGIITMYPSLRGGNTNPGFKEGFLGEADDVLAAADFLVKQPGVDPERIYLGGHSTGGTLALLVAESTNPFRAIFSFGPADDIRGYGPEFMPFDHSIAAELEVRTPAKWIESVQNRTFVLEGMEQPGNVQALQAMSRSSRNSQVSFLAVPRANHFNILAPVTQLIATKILKDEGAATNITLKESELNLSFFP
jgi:alpha/beta superfamily hydrolase/ribosomal protein S27E